MSHKLKLVFMLQVVDHFSLNLTLDGMGELICSSSVICLILKIFLCCGSYLASVVIRIFYVYHSANSGFLFTHLIAIHTV